MQPPRSVVSPESHAAEDATHVSDTNYVAVTFNRRVGKMPATGSHRELSPAQPTHIPHVMNMTHRSLVLPTLLCLTSLTMAAERKDPTRWQKTMDAFAAADQKDAQPPGGIVFVGSSSIRMWNLTKHFPDAKPLNRGFGGSCIADSTHYAQLLVIKHRPKLVVLYAGDNDISQGLTEEQVVADYQRFVATIHDKLPKTRVAFVAIKPSIKRWTLYPRMKSVNERIRAITEQDPRQSYVDIAKPMLYETGEPHKSFFIDDGLHLNEAGYDLWTRLVRPHFAGPIDANFLKWDRNGDGWLKQEELPPHLRQNFDHIDADDDGHISYRESMSAGSDHRGKTTGNRVNGQPVAQGSNTGKTRFLRLRRDANKKPDRLDTAIVRYVPESGNAGLAIDLVAVVHIGDSSYFQELNRRFGEYDVVLYELVAPKGTVVPKGGGQSSNNPISMLQGMTKSMLGLASQVDHIDYTRPNMVHADLSPQELSAAMKKRGEDGFTLVLSATAHALRQANLHQARVEETNETKAAESIDLFSVLTDPQRDVKLKRMLAEQFASVDNFDGTMLGPGLDRLLVADRNAAAVRELQKQIVKGQKRIAIFYGAAHMTDFEQRLIRDFGMRKENSQWLTAWDINKRQTKSAADPFTEILRLLPGALGE